MVMLSDGCRVSKRVFPFLLAFVALLNEGTAGVSDDAQECDAVHFRFYIEYGGVTYHTLTDEMIANEWTAEVANVDAYGLPIPEIDSGTTRVDLSESFVYLGDTCGVVGSGNLYSRDARR